jgi:2-oxoglutarate ferredoxin oxidoreductase subunit alpha
MSKKKVEEIQRVAIRFTGDSGDGMQLTGTKFTESTALAGNDLATLPDFPAEIRAPAGTLAGVSGFQVHFASEDVRTPADHPDVLVAFNPAALKSNIGDVRPGGMVIVNSDAFNEKANQKAGYDGDPLAPLRDSYQLVEIPFTRLNREAIKDLGLSGRDADRTKNFFALGLMFWLYNRPMDSTLKWLEQQFKGRGAILEANQRVLKAGYAFGETTELFPVSYTVPAAKIQPGLYRNITGGTALAWGIVATKSLTDLPLLLAAYPITPASEVLHEVSRYLHYGLKTFQAEDEIAAMSAAVGAAYTGAIGITTTSGPGFVLKQEALGLAVMAELPLVVVDVQRAGPSTGMPTKNEQADLLLALFGRNSDSPLPVIAPQTPGDCFFAVIEAVQMAIKYMTPVVLISDSFLANSAEPWLIPNVEALPRISASFAKDAKTFKPYQRDKETLARPWAIPGTPGLEHRIGGLSKQDVTGGVSYDGANAHRMQELRHEKVARIANELPPVEINGAPRGDLLVVGWGGTFGAISSAVDEARADGKKVSSIHLRHLNPFPANLGEVLRSFDRVLVPELNRGQLSKLLRAEFLVDAVSLSKLEGQPFRVEEIRARIDRLLQGDK